MNVARKDDGCTPLHIASENGNSRIVSLLLKGKDESYLAVDKASTNDGTSPLYAASERGHADVVRSLLEDGGADISKAAKKHSGSTALYTASKNGHIEVVRLLLFFMGQRLMKLAIKMAGHHSSFLVKTIMSKLSASCLSMELISRH